MAFAVCLLGFLAATHLRADDCNDSILDDGPCLENPNPPCEGRGQTDCEKSNYNEQVNSIVPENKCLFVGNNYSHCTKSNDYYVTTCHGEWFCGWSKLGGCSRFSPMTPPTTNIYTRRATICTRQD
jgi:hypothetical protein